MAGCPVASTPVLFGSCRKSAARHSCLLPKSVVAHRRVKQAVSNPQKTAADDNKRLTDEEGYRTQSDDWTGRSSRRGGAAPGAWGQNRKTPRRQTDAPSVDKLGYERLVFMSYKPSTGKNLSFIFNTHSQGEQCAHGR